MVRRKLEIGDKVYTGCYIGRAIKVEQTEVIGFMDEKFVMLLFKNGCTMARPREKIFETENKAKDYYAIVKGRKILEDTRQNREYY